MSAKKKSDFGARDPREMAKKPRKPKIHRYSDPRQTDNRRGNTYHDRLADGFKMMRESGDGY